MSGSPTAQGERLVTRLVSAHSIGRDRLKNVGRGCGRKDEPWPRDTTVFPPRAATLHSPTADLQMAGVEQERGPGMYQVHEGN